MAERCGMHAQILRFSETVQQSRLLKIIADLMADSSIHGIVAGPPLRVGLKRSHPSAQQMTKASRKEEQRSQSFSRLPP